MSRQNPSYLKATENHSKQCTLIAMEECSELIQAISKAKRGKLNKNNLTEEIADVLICIHWLQKIYNITMEDIYEWMDKKEDRIMNKLNKGEFM
ncbi:hypothetical protein UT300012_33050 [Paraclostridium bifermentans]